MCSFSPLDACIPLTYLQSSIFHVSVVNVGRTLHFCCNFPFCRLTVTVLPLNCPHEDLSCPFGLSTSPQPRGTYSQVRCYVSQRISLLTPVLSHARKFSGLRSIPSAQPGASLTARKRSNGHRPSLWHRDASNVTHSSPITGSLSDRIPAD